jgi:hypothetical protein
MHQLHDFKHMHWPSTSAHNARTYHDEPPWEQLDTIPGPFTGRKRISRPPLSLIRVICMWIWSQLERIEAAVAICVLVALVIV